MEPVPVLFAQADAQDIQARGKSVLNGMYTFEILPNLIQYARPDWNQALK